MTRRFETIEKYLNGQLDGEELQAFNERLKTDATFATEVESTRLMLNELNVFGKRKVLKNQLDKIHDEMNTSSSNSKSKIFSIKPYFKTMAVAASVALITSFATFIIANQWNASDKEVAYYRELRMDVDKIKQSNRKMWDTVFNDRKVANTGNFSGTGFAISTNGYLATSYHLVKNADSVFIENDKFSSLKVKTVFTDKTLDIAILKVMDSDFNSFGKIHYGFNANNKELGERIFTLGFPREDVVYGEGYISAGTGYNGDTNAYQVSVPVNPGNSGGPLFDEKGNIVGVVCGKHSQNEGTAFALKTLYLQNIISKLEADSSNIHIPIKPKANYIKTTSMVKKYQNLIFRVRVFK